MSASVDVLAVMGRDASDANQYRYEHPGMYSDGERALARVDSDAVSAAVAELMERERVMREALEDLRQQCKNNLELGATCSGYWTDAKETIDAALGES